MSIYIYNFHRVSNEYSPAYPPMPIKTFEQVIKYLIRHYTIIPQEALLDVPMSYSKKDRCIITFDDGYKDFMESALPILVKHQVPVALHIVSNTATTGEMFWTQKLNKILEAYYKKNQSISGIYPKTYHIKSTKELEKVAVKIYLQLLHDNNRDMVINAMTENFHGTIDNTPMLLWEDIKALPKDIVAIGSHTHSHANLFTLSEKEAYNELFTSYEQIQSQCGIAPISIAYPNGQYNERINAMAKEIGYKIMYTCNGCHNEYNTQGLYHRAVMYSMQYWKNWAKLTMWNLRK